VPGCLDLARGGDLDFDGSSYLFDWPDGTSNSTATSVSIGSVLGSGIGPLSVSGRAYDQPYSQIQFETDVPASEKTCRPNGQACVVPPVHAAFYPFYSLSTSSGCALLFGNFSGTDFNSLGGDAQFGASNLAWFFGTDSGGIQGNPCTPGFN